MNSNCQSKLAIATVPIQEPDLNSLYDAEEALITGTIFPELNKPFFITETGPKQNGKAGVTDKEKLIIKIMEHGFIVQDLLLYLDTHPEDTKAVSMYLNHLEQLKQLKADFANKHYPLTENCMADMNNKNGKFAWTLGPAPWEGVYE